MSGWTCNGCSDALCVDCRHAPFRALEERVLRLRLALEEIASDSVAEPVEFANIVLDKDDALEEKRGGG